MNKENYNKEEWGGWKIVSNMLDHPDENGIYPTSKCYQKLYEFVVAQKKKANQDLLEKIKTETMEIIKNEIAKADKYEVAPLERIRIELIQYYKPLTP